MTNHSATDTEVQDTLQAVELYLEKAEQRLWSIARQTADQEAATVATDLTNQIWAVQHSLEDARHRLENDKEIPKEATPTQ